MTIHTFGDSHASNIYSGWKDCDGVISHHLGPVLCYSFGKEKLFRCDISNFDIKNNDSVVFCFGEIDCRCHVNKHITYKKTFDIIINEIVCNYADAIKINIENCKVKLKTICIYNVVPPVNSYNTSENKVYPFLGSDDERKSYVLYFNKRLKEICEEYGWIFFDIYDFYTDTNGFLNKELSDGGVHIKNGRFLKEFINKLSL